jgi:hypothetical protein
MTQPTKREQLAAMRLEDFKAHLSTSRSHNACFRVYDAAGNVIETHEHKGDFKEW